MTTASSACEVQDEQNLQIPTLLGIWAHPDDEAYLSSGLMGQVRDEGGRVVVVTATRGEHGTDDPERWPPELLGPVRERELRRSLAEVDVHEHRWLAFHDGELGDIPTERGVSELVAIIDEVRPDVIVTFGPDGMTGHGDHRAISAWTELAWRRTGCRSALWFATLTPDFHREWGDLNTEVGLWMDDVAGPSTDPSDLAAEVRLSGRELARKHRSLRAHASQTRALETLVGTSRYRDWWAVESFVPAHSRFVRREPRLCLVASRVSE